MYICIWATPHNSQGFYLALALYSVIILGHILGTVVYAKEQTLVSCLTSCPISGSLYFNCKHILFIWGPHLAQCPGVTTSSIQEPFCIENQIWVFCIHSVPFVSLQSSLATS